MVDAVSASLFARSRTGDLDARGELLALCRNYLKVLARSRIDKNLRVRCDDSDLVQETLMEALRFSQFRRSHRERATCLAQVYPGSQLGRPG